MDCKLQIFKNDSKEGHSGWTYRFAVVDSSRSKSYPANFVCMLPIKVNTGKTSDGSAFGALFGDQGLDLAIGLLSNALKTEKDAEVKTEIEKRLKLLGPKEFATVKCSGCNKAFYPRKNRRYKQLLCNECVAARYASKNGRL